MKEFAELTALLNEVAQKYDPEYTVDVSGDFMALLDENKICYSPIISEKGGEEFKQFIVKQRPICEIFSVFLLSFMHELGHLETEMWIEDDTDERNEITDPEEYFNLYNERIATNWAILEVTDHLVEFCELDRKIMRILKETWDKIPD